MKEKYEALSVIMNKAPSTWTEQEISLVVSFIKDSWDVVCDYRRTQAADAGSPALWASG